MTSNSAKDMATVCYELAHKIVLAPSSEIMTKIQLLPAELRLFIFPAVLLKLYENMLAGGLALSCITPADFDSIRAGFLAVEKDIHESIAQGLIEPGALYGKKIPHPN